MYYRFGIVQVRVDEVCNIRGWTWEIPDFCLKRDHKFPEVPQARCSTYIPRGIDVTEPALNLILLARKLKVGTKTFLTRKNVKSWHKNGFHAPES